MVERVNMLWKKDKKSEFESTKKKEETQDKSLDLTKGADLENIKLHIEQKDDKDVERETDKAESEKARASILKPDELTV